MPKGKYSYGKKKKTKSTSKKSGKKMSYGKKKY